MEVYDCLMKVDQRGQSELPPEVDRLLDKVDRFLHPPEKPLPDVEIMITGQNNRAVIRVLRPSVMEETPQAIADRYLASYKLEGDWRVDSAKSGVNEDACIAVITAVRRVQKRVTPEMPSDPAEMSAWWAVLNDEERAVFLKALEEVDDSEA
jgi:hypothetical protein